MSNFNNRNHAENSMNSTNTDIKDLTAISFAPIPDPEYQGINLIELEREQRLAISKLTGTDAFYDNWPSPTPTSYMIDHLKQIVMECKI